MESRSGKAACQQNQCVRHRAKARRAHEHGRRIANASAIDQRGDDSGADLADGQCVDAEALRNICRHAPACAAGDTHNRIEIFLVEDDADQLDPGLRKDEGGGKGYEHHDFVHRSLRACDLGKYTPSIATRRCKVVNRRPIQQRAFAINCRDAPGSNAVAPPRFAAIAAFVRAELHIVPVALPFLAPDEWAAAGDAEFLRQIGFLAHFGQGGLHRRTGRARQT